MEDRSEVIRNLNKQWPMDGMIIQSGTGIVTKWGGSGADQSSGEGGGGWMIRSMVGWFRGD